MRPCLLPLPAKERNGGRRVGVPAVAAALHVQPTGPAVRRCRNSSCRLEVPNLTSAADDSGIFILGAPALMIPAFGKPSRQVKQLNVCAFGAGEFASTFTNWRAPMTDDPNKKQNDPLPEWRTKRPAAAGTTIWPQQKRNTDDSSQKRPSQGGTDAEQMTGETRPGWTAESIVKF